MTAFGFDDVSTQTLVADRWRREPPALLDPQHFREYTIASLTAAGEVHGLRPVDMFGYGLQSLLHPRWTPSDYRRSTSWGARLRMFANVISLLFQKGDASRS